MPWQRHVADVALEVDPVTGRLVYRQVGLTVPRQSGKTTLILALAVHRALGFGSKQSIVYTAQTRIDARKKWEDDHVETLRASIFKPLFRVRKTTGNEAIFWQGGSSHSITSNTKKAGHGGTLDLAFIDEAFAHPDSTLEQAFKPAMVTRKQAQLWIVSTAGTPEQSHYLRAKIEAGRLAAESGQTKGVAYFEWSAPEDADPEDPAVWHTCMPALGHTIDEDVIAADYDAMSKEDNLNEFRRAYLNQWCDKVTHTPVVDPELWAKRAHRKSQLDGAFAMSVDINPERSASSIGAAGRRKDGRWHYEVIKHGRGTAWVLDDVVELYRKWNPVSLVLDPASAAGSLIPELQERGIEPFLLNKREITQACGSLFDDIHNDKARHLDQPELNAALFGAKKRPFGDAWAWSRKDSTVDISPLVAVTMAAHGFAVYGNEEEVEPWVAFA